MNGSIQYQRKLPVALPIGLENPKDNALSREGQPQCFPIAIPKRLAGKKTICRAPEYAPEHDSEWVIEPDNKIRFVKDPDKVHIIAVRDPALALDLAINAFCKIGRMGPVRAMINRIQFDMLDANSTCERTQKRRFPDADEPMTHIRL
jgi:hypothetical protein